MNAPSMVGRILVVDDNPVDRALLVRFLVGDGHQPIETDSGESALAMLSDGSHEVDLVLLDLLMPGLDGFQTLATIKADPALAHLPVIVISGLDELEFRRPMHRDGRRRLHPPAVQAAAPARPDHRLDGRQASP